MGPQGAKVTILEFADFECPACRQFEPTLRAARAKYPSDVAVVFRHWPLPYHHFALPAARAAECANAQGRFEAMHDLLYARQDSLGLKSFASFAADAGVADTAAFDVCNRSGGPVMALAADTTDARQLGGRGTPTVVVNGLLLGVPNGAALDKAIQDALKSTK
jgi:protein-disulfide isomerase